MKKREKLELNITDIHVNNSMNKAEQLFPIMHPALPNCSCQISLVEIYVFIRADFLVIKSSGKKSNLFWCWHLLDRTPGGAVFFC